MVWSRRLAIGLVLSAAAGAASAQVRIDVDLGAQIMRVAAGSGESYAWPISSGALGRATPRGEFRPYALYPMVHSWKYGNEPMPYSIFFHGQYAIHGTLGDRPARPPRLARLHPPVAARRRDVVRAGQPGRGLIHIGGGPEFVSRAASAASHAAAERAGRSNSRRPIRPLARGRQQRDSRRSRPVIRLSRSGAKCAIRRSILPFSASFEEAFVERRQFLAGAAGLVGGALIPRFALAKVPTPFTFDLSPPMDSREKFIAWGVAQRGEDPKFLGERFDRFGAMVRNEDIWDERHKRAFLLTPREKFVLPQNLGRAYEHAFLDIGYGVTISGPHIVGRMTSTIDPKAGEKVLEIGTGSGYQSAYLSHLTDQVYTIEIIKPIAERTRGIYDALIADGYVEFKAIQSRNADGYYGWVETPAGAPSPAASAAATPAAAASPTPSASPAPAASASPTPGGTPAAATTPADAGPIMFDKIIVTCGIDHVPPPLLQQLKPNGIMVIPVGPPGAQRVLKVVKNQAADGTITVARSDIYGGRIVPFVPFTKLEGDVIKGTHNN